jgi:hypothetical protein
VVARAPRWSPAVTSVTSDRRQSDTTTASAAGWCSFRAAVGSPSRSRASRACAASMVPGGSRRLLAHMTGTRSGSNPAGPGSLRTARRSSPIGRLRHTCLAPGSVAFPADSLSTCRFPKATSLYALSSVGASADTPILVPMPAASIGTPSVRNRAVGGVDPSRALEKLKGKPTG